MRKTEKTEKIEKTKNLIIEFIKANPEASFKDFVAGHPDIDEITLKDAMRMLSEPTVATGKTKEVKEVKEEKERKTIASNRASKANKNTRKKKMGETRTMKNGLACTIIDYFDYNHITVKFENGEKRTDVNYNAFKKGSVKCPPVLGESKMMKCGQGCKIIKILDLYRVNVRFDDGTICKNQRHIDFEKGRIQPTKIKKNQEKKIGITIKQSCGLDATIIGGIDRDLTVRFEDGVVVEHVSRSNFRKGKVGHPNINSRNRRNPQKCKMFDPDEWVLQKGCQLKAHVIDWQGYRHITVEFEDGKIVQDAIYKNFLNGMIGHPDINASTVRAQVSVGETNVMRCGQKATIISGTKGHLIVQFEDGSIVCDKNYDEFKEGTIAPGKKVDEKIWIYQEPYEQIAHVTEFFEKRNVTVELKDGTVLRNQTLKAFLTGRIGDLDSEYKRYDGNNWIVQKACGLKAHIIEWRCYIDVTVEFEDGAITEHVKAERFRTGNVKHPSIGRRPKMTSKGEKK